MAAVSAIPDICVKARHAASVLGAPPGFLPGIRPVCGQDWIRNHSRPFAVSEY